MGKITGFLDITRQESQEEGPLQRIQHFNEFHTPLSHEKRACQGARCMDCGIPFCQSGTRLGGKVTGCPLHNLIPEWNDAVYHGQYKQALSRLLKTNNFPEFTGRVCPALCEAACTCGLHDEAVTIKENELAIIEEAFATDHMQPMIPQQRIDKKIAIVGSGPAGLAAADQLNKRGYTITVYEKEDRLGGLLMYGIPNMKLEKKIIERRISLMKAEGVTFQTNTGITTKQQAKKLCKEYERVILTCGSRKPRNINAPGRDGKGIYFAVDYLTKVTKSILNSQLKDQQFPKTKDKIVLVIGGGDTGNDCVGTAIRLGCKDVIQLEIMAELPSQRQIDNPWPQWPIVKKTDYGQSESIAVFDKDPRVYQTTVKEFILDDNQQVKQARLVSLQTVKDKTGNIRFEEIKKSERIIDVDIVLIAAGFIGVESDIINAFDLKTTNEGNVGNADYRTNIKDVFVAGDMKIGQSLVVSAINEGRNVAREVDQDIMGYTNL